MQKIRVGVIYPTDPTGKVIGGVDSFIRGLIKYAPEDISYVVFGATTDPMSRPVGRWSECWLGDRPFEFYPVVKMSGSGFQPRMPATVSYELGALLSRLDHERCDILESHRMEHFLVRGDHKPINLFLHQDMAVLKKSEADIRWKYMPALYGLLERRVLLKVSSVYCVREEAADNYKKLYPDMGEKFAFQSTWMDPEIFYPVMSSERPQLRSQVSSEMMIPDDRKWLVAVGRIDYQKAPLLMIEAFAKVLEKSKDVHLVWVGEGILRQEMLDAVARSGLSEHVTLAGLLPPDKIAELHRVADMFVMSSAYEGMPIALIEAMACGLPAVTTDVGEVKRLVKPGYNGGICPAGDAEALAQTIRECLKLCDGYSGENSIEVANQYTPENVLESVYNNYRQLAAR